MAIGGSGEISGRNLFYLSSASQAILRNPECFFQSAQLKEAVKNNEIILDNILPTSLSKALSLEVKKDKHSLVGSYNFCHQSACGLTLSSCLPFPFMENWGRVSIFK